MVWLNIRSNIFHKLGILNLAGGIPIKTIEQSIGCLTREVVGTKEILHLATRDLSVMISIEVSEGLPHSAKLFRCLEADLLAN